MCALFNKYIVFEYLVPLNEKARHNCKEFAMTDLLTLVGVLYACNMMAEQARLAPDQALLCERTHHAVKLKFLTAAELDSLENLPTGKQYRIGLEGYRRFKTWERDNPELVERLRREQEQRVLSGS